MILDGERQRTPFQESFDFVIVGSGAAGGAAARVLAEAGARIAIVEEGPAASSADFTGEVFPTFRRLYRGMGGQFARGRAIIPVLQGSCLGGSTTINSAICRRMPEDVWAEWEAQNGLGKALPLDGLHARWDQIERELHVRPTAREVQGRNSRLLETAGERLHAAGRPLPRYETGCRGSGRCSTGCPHGAKQGMAISYLPYASERGALILTSARADRVTFKGGRATGVAGHFHLPQWRRNLAAFTLHARRGVILAASAIQTPGLLRRSGVRSPHLGRHFQGHPGAAVIGVFDEPVSMWSGATQGYEIDEHRRESRFKIETLSLPPDALFYRLPGMGRAWAESIAQAAHMAHWVVVLRARVEGAVKEGPFGTDILFAPTAEDVKDLRRGLRFTAELLFAAGAREVIPGVHGLPERLRRSDDARLLESGPDDPACYSLTLTHLFGTARMSPRPAGGVVGPDFGVHGTAGLYVIDSSVFPTNIGVNPQHAVMGVAMHAARKIAGLL